MSELLMKLKMKYLILILIFFSSKFSSAQTDAEDVKTNSGLNWFVSPGIGLQMSGIKDEDFVSHNIAPLINITAGKWFSKELALQVGYKGPYYNAIADDKKHHYYFVYWEAIVNLNSFCRNYRQTNLWRLLLHTGPGYYYNYDYSRPNVCINLGVTNDFRLTKKFHPNLDISAIVGWDIYQGDEDILPGISAGIMYLF
jgi:hypothetical protein